MSADMIIDDEMSQNEDILADLLSDAQAPDDDSDAPNYLALKYTFFTPKNGDASGGFCLIFEGETGKTIQQVLWLTRKQGVTVDFSPGEHWQNFVKLLMKLGPYDRIWGDKLNVLLPDMLPNEERTEIFMESIEELHTRPKLTSVKNELRKSFERATHCFLEVDCETELLTRSELESVGLIQSASAKQSTTTEQREADPDEDKFSGTIIQCTPVIDPIWGEAASSISPGDFVEVEIEESMGASGLVKKFLAATNQAPIFPVEEVSFRDGRTRIFLRISEEIIGLITLTKDLKIKTQQSAADKKSERTVIDDLVFFGGLACAVVGILLIMRYLFF